MHIHLFAAAALAVLAGTVMAQVGPGPDEFAAQLEEERLDQSGTVITIIFDDSGSMRGERLQQAKKAFAAWLPTVPEEHRLGLYALNAGALAKWRRGNREDVGKAVAAIKADGGTPLAAVLEHVEKLVAERQKSLPYERHVVLVFTDGKDNTDRGTTGVLRQIGRARASGIEVVGIGFHGQGDYMSKDATRYFNANNAEELSSGLEKVDAEIGDTDDVKIEPEVLEMMKSVTFEPPPKPQARVAPEPAPDEPESASFIGVLVSGVVIVVIMVGLIKAFSG